MPEQPSTTSSKKKRRSLFGFSLKSSPAKSTTDPSQPPPPSAFKFPTSTDPAEALSLEDRLRPRQWSPNRLATLYVTPSERNLYLAAMSQLDQAPPPLPLWSEPPPTLPPGTTSPLRVNPPLPAGPAASASQVPLSPKLVTSPNGASGLMVREEFRSPSRAASTQHALLSLANPAALKFTGFPVQVLSSMDEAIAGAWPQGVKNRSESIESLKKRSDGSKWKIKLEGKAWKKPGDAELE